LKKLRGIFTIVEGFPFWGDETEVQQDQILLKLGSGFEKSKEPK
jgi:hypothetical protein